MKKTSLPAAVILIALISGCVTGNAQTSKAPKAVKSTPPSFRLKTQAKADFSVVSEVNTKVRAVFKFSAKEMDFCMKLADRLSERIVQNKAEIVHDSPHDVEISLTPEFELLDKSGGYYRINCKQITVELSSKRKVYAVKTIEPKPLSRKLGEENARNQYLSEAVKELAPFLEKELERIGNEQIAVSVVDFTLANVQKRPEPQAIAAQVNKISQILSSTSGVISFTNIRQDVSKATCSFRIVYMKEQYPQGITNILNEKLAAK